MTDGAGGTAPYFSVIINNYNYARFLREAIDSVLAQTCPDFELIIVDDGSTDGSRELIDGYRDPRVVPVKKGNGGQLSCFYAALAHVRAGVACFLDSDDVYEPGYLSALKGHYERGLSDAAFCNVRLFGNEDRVYHAEGGSVVIEDSYFLARYSEKFWQGPTSSLSMRAGLLSRILQTPGFAADWAICADAVLAWGVSLNQGSIGYIPDVLVRYRVHGDNAIYSNRLDHAELKARRAREREAARRYQALYPGAGFVGDFGGIWRELRKSPIPLAYKDLMGSRLWVFGRLLCKIIAKGKKRPGFAHL